MVKYLNFVINKAVVNIFAEILHAGRAALDMKHINGDFRLPGVGYMPGYMYKGTWSRIHAWIHV